MISGYIVKKGEMTSIFSDKGKKISVTKCTALPLTVTQIKTDEKDRYSAIQVAVGEKNRLPQAVEKKLKKLKLKIKPLHFKEFKLTADTPPAIGDQITFDSVFQINDIVSVAGTTKGRGFAGVIKRHGFHRQPVTGGQSDRTRAPGSIGAQTPGKVLKGKKMPGHFGNTTHTVSNLKIISFDSENNQAMISGSVPGHTNSWIIISKSKHYDKS